jgi:hypothetical protein
MAIKVPEIIIASALNNILTTIRTNHIDAINNSQEDRSLLYLLFNTVALGNYDFYENAKRLLITTPQDPKHIEVKLSFDQNEANSIPSVFVSMSSDTPAVNSISTGEGDQDELMFANIGVQDEYIRQYRRGFQTTYRVVILSDNKNEVSVLYNLLRAILISATEHFVFEGLDNLKIGGQDVRLDTGVPERLYMRTITMDFHYEIVTPAVFISDIFTKLRFIASIDQSAHYTIEDDSDSI